MGLLTGYMEQVRKHCIGLRSDPDWKVVTYPYLNTPAHLCISFLHVLMGATVIFAMECLVQ